MAKSEKERLEDDPLYNSTGNQSAEQLRGYIARIEGIEKEIRDLNFVKADIYKEARKVGFDRAAMREVVKRRRRDYSEQHERDLVVELYEAVLSPITRPGSKNAQQRRLQRELKERGILVN